MGYGKGCGMRHEITDYIDDVENALTRVKK